MFGGANEDAVDDVAVDAEGNVYVAGHVGGPSATIGTSTLTPTAGGAAAFLLVLSGEGAMRWVRRVGDGVYDHACGVVVGTGGDVFVLVNETITSGAGAVALLASFSPTGTLRWSRSLPGASCGSPSGLTLDAEGNLHVALRAGRSIDVGAGPVAVAHDTLTASFTRDGAFRSMIQFVDDNDLYLEASLSEIAFGSSGDGYAVGSFNGRLTAGAFSRTSAGGVDGFVAGVTSTGSVRWLRTLGGSGAENVWSVAVDASGDALITGALSGGRVMWGAEEFAPSVTRRGVFVARLASDGALRWSRRYPSTYAMALLRGASFNAAGEARFSGYFDHGMDFGFGPIATSKGAFVLRFGPSGDQRALRVIELPDELYNPVVRAREDAIVLGASFGHGVSTAPTSTVEGLTFRSVGPSDSVLLRLAP